MKLNNKGFTLVEVLAVLIILVAIMAVAITSITSSIERSKAKQNNAKIKMLESFAEIYVTNHKNAIDNKLESNGNEKCYITLSTLREESFFKEDADLDADGKEFKGRIIYTKPNSYEYKDSYETVINECR